MTPYITANYSTPAVQGLDKSNVTAATNTGTTTSGTEASDIGTTFLSLLTQELKNQDPTAPMDSTAMVGQMISLNQLAQLTSINQAVGGSTTTVTGATHTAPSSADDKSAAITPAKVANDNLPFDPKTMMPMSSSPIRSVDQQL
jgi:flagellar basal-body rod modification protein FlgD